MTLKNKGSYGKNVCVAISLPVSILEEVEKRRRFDSRSRYILRAVDRYLREEEKEEKQESKGVRGSESSNQVPTAPTPTYTEALKTNTFLRKGGFRG